MKEKETSMKEKIKQKAFELMAQKGLRAISMREIAEACGVSKPVLYYYFKDKEDLCYSLIAEASALGNEKLRKKIDSGASLEEILVFIFSMHIDNFPKGGVPFLIHVASYLLSNPEAQKRFEGIGELKVDILQEVLDKEYKKGNITKKGKEIGLHMILAISSHSIKCQYKNDIKFWRSYPQDMARAVLSAINYWENRK